MFFLFLLYLNDFEEYFYINNVRGLLCLFDNIKKDFNIYLNFFVLLYVDDIILLLENLEDF